MRAVSDVEFAGLLEVSEAIARRDLSSAEVVTHLLRRIERLEPTIHAFSHVCSDAALRQARDADDEIARGVRRGPLHGVPIAVKDLLFTRDHPTASGMRIFADWYPDEDATAVARLRQAGAVIVGKAQMTEGAMIAHHPDVAVPVNPWKADRSTGFSSSGSGAAVAAGLCYGALGSDTGGSIRIPSAMNGTTGLKPTWGRVSRHGVFPLVEYLDTIGPLARSAADAAAMLGAIAGADRKDPTAVPVPVPDYLATIGGGISAVRIGLDLAAIERCCDPVIVAVVREAAAGLSAVGADVRDVAMPEMDMSALFPLISAGVADAHRATYPARADEYGPGLRDTLDHARAISGMDVAAAINRADALRGALAYLFTTIDLLLVPVTTRPTPKAGAMEQAMRDDPAPVLEQLRFNGVFNVSGQPSIALRGGTDRDGMPVGFQLVARHFEEELLFRAGHAYQRVTDWHLRRPVLTSPEDAA